MPAILRYAPRPFRRHTRFKSWLGSSHMAGLGRLVSFVMMASIFQESKIQRILTSSSLCLFLLISTPIFQSFLCACSIFGFARGICGGLDSRYCSTIFFTGEFLFFYFVGLCFHQFVGSCASLLILRESFQWAF